MDIVSAITKLVACVCAKDGILSQVEEQKMFLLLQESFPHLTEQAFEAMLIDFFDSEHQIDDYLGAIVDDNNRRLALTIAESSASEDGLDPRENIALDRAYIFWGIPRDA